MTCRKAAGLAAASLVLLAAAARADDLTTAPTAGVQQPANSAALDDEPTALSDNPGGLAFVSGFGLNYVRQQSYTQAAGSGDAFHGAFSLGPLVLGAGLEWLRPDGCPLPGCTTRARRTSLGFGLRGGIVGLGAVHHSFGGSNNFAVDELSSWDVGVMVRPSRHLSLSFAALDVDGPRFGAIDLQRRYVVGAGIRPFGEHVTLAADAAFTSCADNSPVPCGTSNPGWRFVADLEAGRGIHLLGQAVRNAQLERWSGQVAIGIDFRHFGLRYGQALHNDAGAQGSLKVRLSSEAWEGVRIGRRAVLVKLDEALTRKGPGVAGLVLGAARRDPHAETLAALRKLGRDPSVAAVVLRSSGIPGSAGKAEELRRAVANLRSAGKKVVFFLESGGDLEYYVASAADRILAAPQAVLAINGFSATALFAAAGLHKLGVKAEFVRVGAYKNAPDIFTREDMSAEQREVQNALLDDVYGRYVHEVAVRRNLPEEKVKALLDRGLLRPTEAVEAGLLDGLAYPDQLEREVNQGSGGLSLREVSIPGEPERHERWGPRPRIALIRVEGDIAGGESRGDPFGVARMVGSKTVAGQIRKAADDPGVKAIVVRIDSPGGDGNASDLIWRELVRARKEKKKPVVASMGDVAASGGYYVAAGADEIWAEPSTITGSIGVFVPKFSAQELYGNLGLHFETVKRGQSADLFTTTRPLDDAERKTLQAWVDEFYRQFLDRVAEARGMTRDQVHAVAQGRVWTGRQAQERKLVDQLGGLDQALASARTRAGLSPHADVQVQDQGRAAFELSELASASPGDKADLVLSLMGLPRKDAEQALRALQIAGEPGTLRAILPYVIEVH